MSVVESWITEGKNDKSTNYGFNFPKGTWVISMKVNNDEIWNKVKLGEVKGFSIEGYFADKYEMSLINEDEIKTEVIMILETPNKQGRIYKSEDIAVAISKYTGQLWCHIGNTPNGQIDMEKIAAEASNLRIENNTVVADIRI